MRADRAARKREAVRALPEGFVFRASGTSMLPGLRPGDALRVVQAGSYRPGEILIFEHDGTLLAHRLVGRERGHDGPRLILRGDNRLRPDPPVPPSAVVGRVRSIERRGRRIPVDGLRGRAFRLLAGLSLFGIPLFPLPAAALRRAAALWRRPRLSERAATVR